MPDPLKSRSAGVGPQPSLTRWLGAMGTILALLAPYRGRFCAGLLALLIGSGINLVFPEVVRRALEPANFPWVLEHVGLMTAVVAALCVVQGVAFFLRSYLFGEVGQRVVADLRGQLFRAILCREASFFDQSRPGELVSRINSDAGLVQDVVAVKLSVLLRYGLQVVAGIVLMAWMSWRMTLAIVSSVLCIVVVSTLFAKSLKAASRAYQAALARLTGFAAECFSGAKVVKSLGAEHEAGASFLAVNSEVFARGQHRVRISASFSSGASLLLNLLLLLVQWYGIHLVISQQLPLNDLAAFGLYGAIVAVSFSFLVNAYAELLQGIGGLERVFGLLGAPVRAARRMDPEREEAPVGVTLENVSFSYPGREALVLENLSFDIPAGRATGLVGPSGSGKSSLAQLLLTFYPPTAGRILVNGMPLVMEEGERIRDSVAWVPQEPCIFGFSAYENLVFGNSEAPRTEVERLVRSWGFLDFVDALPQGFDTVLGERGAQLSGGQKQRLAIARALLRRPGLLILDEATSGLDSHTEAQVFRAIRAAIPGCTQLVISHRLSTVRHASSIVVLNEGRIFEQGTHEELMKGNGLYSQYAMRQALG